VKVSSEQSERNRSALVQAARRLFRERGFDSVTVADIASSAGMTHGAFYSHFPSKRAVEALAVASIIEKAAADWRETVDSATDDPLLALVDGYLGFDHVSPGDVGCAFAALGAEMARTSEDVRRAAGEALPRQIKVLERLFDDGDASGAHRRALAAYASLVGAATIMQAISDEASRQNIRAAVVEQVISLRVSAKREPR